MSLKQVTVAFAFGFLALMCATEALTGNSAVGSECLAGWERVLSAFAAFGFVSIGFEIWSALEGK